MQQSTPSLANWLAAIVTMFLIFLVGFTADASETVSEADFEHAIDLVYEFDDEIGYSDTFYPEGLGVYDLCINWYDEAEEPLPPDVENACHLIMY